MKNHRHLLGAAALAVALLLPSVLLAGQPRVKSRTGTYQSSNGNSGTFKTSTTSGPGSRQSSTIWTNQNGQSGDHASSSNWNKSTDSGSFSSSTTLIDGKSASRNGTITETAPNTYQIQGTQTGFNGQTSTFDFTKTKSASGSSTVGTITGPKGGVSTYDSTVTKTDNGYTRDTAITGPNGGQTTKDTTFTKSTGETVKNTETTLADGQKTDRVVDTKYNADGSGTRTVEYTGPDGKTQTRTETFSAPVITPIPPKG